VIVVPFVRFLQNVFCASHLPRQVEALPPEGAEEELPNVLKVQDVPEENVFFQKGLGPNSEMLFGRGPLQDRRLLERILLQGASEFKVAKLVDIYHVVEITGEGESRKRRKIRPSVAKAMWVFAAVFLASRGKRLQISTKLLCWSLQIKIPGVCRSS